MTTAAAIHPLDRYVSVPRAAAILGIGASGMRRLLDEGAIPCIRPQSHRRVKIRDIRQYERDVREGGAVQFATCSENALE